ncbi:GntR family transcriptional regulator [Rhodococcus sp. WS4]|nr:GntR family transcriptional regulator [Rhodococcus sp. WS4]
MSKHGTTSEFVYSQVKELIISGEIRGGELTSEGAIANVFGTSRTPVREAFLRLESEGWMTLYPKRGALVNPVAQDEGAHIVEARLLIETGCVRSFIGDHNHREDAAADLNGSLSRQRTLAENGERDAFSAEDADFHAIFVRYGGNPLLSEFYAGLRDRQRRMTSSSVGRDPSQVERIVSDHAELTEYVTAGDIDQFCRVLDTHVREVHQLTRSR